MDFSRRQGIILLSFLFVILFEVTSFSSQDLEKLRAVTIPRELESVSIRAVLESTECSVTCGIGSKKEKRCLVDRSGIQDCEEVIVDCFNDWYCGMQVYTVKVGDHFTMDCGIPSTGTLGGNEHYYWKIVRGLLSSDEQYFRPLKMRNSTIVFESIQEENAGTYCCDVQREDDLKLVKRILFGVRIYSPSIIDIDYDKYVNSKEKLAVMAEELTTKVGEQKVESNDKLYTYVGIGSSVGLLAGVVILLLIRCICRSKVEDNPSCNAAGDITSTNQVLKGSLSASMGGKIILYRTAGICSFMNSTYGRKPNCATKDGVTDVWEEEKGIHTYKQGILGIVVGRRELQQERAILQKETSSVMVDSQLSPKTSTETCPLLSGR